MLTESVLTFLIHTFLEVRVLTATRPKQLKPVHTEEVPIRIFDLNLLYKNCLPIKISNKISQSNFSDGNCHDKWITNEL